MSKALKDKESGHLYPILGPEDFDGYERNRPSSKWELVLEENGERVWMGNNPDFVELVDYDNGTQEER